MSHRGATALFNDIFFDQPQTPVIPISRSGRHEERSRKRDECLVDRYFYIGRVTRKNYHDLLNEVADHFFISPFTAGKVIQANLETLSSLKHRFKIEPIEMIQDHFKKKWPHLVW